MIFVRLHCVEYFVLSVIKYGIAHGGVPSTFITQIGSLQVAAFSQDRIFDRFLQPKLKSFYDMTKVLQFPALYSY